MGRPLEEAQLEKLARAILGVSAEQAKTELASGEISDTPAGEAFAIVLAQARVIEAARAYVEADSGDTPRTYNELRDAVLAAGGVMSTTDQGEK